MRRSSQSPTLCSFTSTLCPAGTHIHQLADSCRGRSHRRGSPSRRHPKLWALCLVGLCGRLSCAFRPIASPRRSRALGSDTFHKSEDCSASALFGSSPWQRQFRGSQLNQRDVTGKDAGISPTKSWISRFAGAQATPGTPARQLGFDNIWAVEADGESNDGSARQPTSRKDTLTILGGLFSLGIVLFLASGYGTADDPLTTAATVSTAGGAWDVSKVVNVERLRDNIIEATLPMTASDAFSVAFGEGFAGIAGGFISAVLSTAVASLLKSLSSVSQDIQKDRGADSATLDDPAALGGSRTTLSRVGNEAVASGDYFLTLSAALPLLEATGLSSTFATVASVVVATIPYEIVKYSQRQRGIMEEEEQRLQVLLEKRNSKGRLWVQVEDFFSQRSSQSVDLRSLTPVLRDSEMKLDLVEVFADVTKWLGYAVLVENYGGTLAWSGLTGSFPYAENFLFGAIANLSSQVYADVLYARFGFAGEEKQRAVLSRSMEEWVTLYVASCVTGATLFGVYEAAQIPAKVLTSALFSGGVEGCYGSTDYNLCVESFLFNGLSPPGPSLEAQLRAILTTLVSIWNRLGLDTPFAS